MILFLILFGCAEDVMVNTKAIGLVSRLHILHYIVHDVRTIFPDIDITMAVKLA